MMKILTLEQEQVLKRERDFLNDLRVRLVDFGASKESLETMGQSIAQLDDLFLLVMVGEFNAGKSAVINAFLGQKLLKEGVTPTTSQINILRYGEETAKKVVAENQEVLLLPVDLLSEVSIVDTPGTNAIVRYHEELTRHFVPRADLVLFITSVDRPFTESERTFMQHIRDWGKKVVIVINKLDILQDEDELRQVEDFVRDNARELLGVAPEIFTVSARLALRAKQGEPDLWEVSQFGPLEAYIQDTLDQESQIKLKFLNPLGVSDHLVQGITEDAQEQRHVLDDDLALLRNIDQQQEVYQKDKEKEFELRMSEIENIFFEMEQRGDEFFEDRFRLARVFDLIKKDQMQRDFEQEVVANVPQRVDQKVNSLIDWLVESDLRQWKAITDYLSTRKLEHKEKIIGNTIGTDFVYDRDRLLEAIGREADRVVATYDKDFETEKIAMDAQNAVAASLAVEIGAVGLGAIITALATTMAADVTGVLTASLVALLGFFIIPASRRKAKKELHETLAELRTKLISTLRKEFKKEITRSVARIEEAIAPYSRFVRAETTRTEEILEALKSASMEIDQLKAEITAW
ncbi:MAG: dynamin family protein [Brevefilum sp.]|nr:dynamin family protein [Brevefilum sp.]MDT8381259.1 dynamin family protein [Brevefilum sp.]